MSKMGQKLEDMNEDCTNLQLKMKQMQEEHNKALMQRRDAERKLHDENKELRKEIKAFTSRKKRLDSSAIMIADANEALRKEVSKRIQLEGELRYTRRLSDNYKARSFRRGSLSS